MSFLSVFAEFLRRRNNHKLTILVVLMMESLWRWEISCQARPQNDKTRRQRQRVLNGGADQDRTDDLYNAIVALSQLSYGPTLSASQKNFKASAARRIFRRFAKCWQDPFSKFLSDRRRLLRRVQKLRQDRRRLRQDQRRPREYRRRYRHRHHLQDH